MVKHQLNMNCWQVMHNGEIVQSGKYDELIQLGRRFSAMIHAHQEAISSITVASKNTTVTDSANNQLDPILKEKEIMQEDNPLLSPKIRQIDANDQKAQLVQDEERERGKVAFHVYWSYLTCVYKGSLVVLACIAQCCFLVCPTLANPNFCGLGKVHNS